LKHSTNTPLRAEVGLKVIKSLAAKRDGSSILWCEAGDAIKKSGLPTSVWSNDSNCFAARD
jgi:hypothetical protein